MAVPRPRLPVEQKAEIIDLFLSGILPADIAASQDLTVADVCRVLREQDIPTGRSGRSSILDRMSLAAIDDITESYLNTEEPVREICRRYGLTNQQFWAFAQALQLPHRRLVADTVTTRKSRLDAAVSYYEQGVPIWKIVEETGLAETTLYKVLRRREIPLRRSK